MPDWKLEFKGLDKDQEGLRHSVKIRKRYNRIAKCYDWLDKPMESAMFSKWREMLASAQVKTYLIIPKM
jgi:ubiquinone/menaquinone biosynthesis C-methylase UbiE